MDELKKLKEQIKFSSISTPNPDVYSIGEDFAIATIPLCDINPHTLPTRLSGLILVVCSEGKGKMNINTKPFEVKKNDIIILPPGQIIQLVERSDDMDAYAIYASEAFMTDNLSMTRSRDMTIFFTIRDNPVVNMSSHDIEIIMLYIKLMLQRIQDKDNPHILATMRHIFNALMSDMSDTFLKCLSMYKAKITRKDEICQNFIKCLRDNYKERRDVGFYADKLCITTKHLSNMLYVVTGKKASAMIDDYVVLQAKIMLSSTNMTISQISRELNFPSQSFFGRYFKRITGMTPTQYRGQ